MKSELGAATSSQNKPGIAESSVRTSFPAVERPTVTVDLPRGWARAVLAGIEAALFGWLVPTLSFTVAFLAVSSNPWLADYPIGGAFRLGTDFWALSLGAPIVVAELPVTLVPLLWTLVQLVVLRLLLLQLRAFDSASVWVGIPAFTVSAVLIVAFSGQTASVWPVLAGALLVSSVAAAWAYSRQAEDFPVWVKRLGWVWSGLRGGLLWFGFTFLTGLILTSAALIGAWDKMADIRRALTGGGLPSIALGTLEGLYLPDFASWAVAWLSGSGFTLSGGAVHSTSSAPVIEGSVLPVVAAVPASAPGPWTPLVLAALGLLLGIWTSVRNAERTLWGAARRGALSVLLFGLLTFGWMWASSGSLGEQKLSALGPTSWAWLVVTGLVGGVALVVSLLAHPETRAGISRVLANRSEVEGDLEIESVPSEGNDAALSKGKLGAPDESS